MTASMIPLEFGAALSLVSLVALASCSTPSAAATSGVPGAAAHANSPAPPAVAEPSALSGPVQLDDASQRALAPDSTTEGQGSFFGAPAFRVYGGYFDAASNPGFANETQRYALGFGVTWRERRRGIFALDADILATKRDFDALFPIGASPPVTAEGQIVTFGLTGGGRATYPVEGPVRFYAGGGLGVYWNELSAKGTGSDAGFAGTDKNFDPGAYLLAGVDVTLGHLLLGLSYRRWFLESSFSGFGLEDVDLGGDFAGLVIGASF